MSKLVERIAQEDANGCVVAALAMITGKTYAQVRDEIQAFVGSFGEDHSIWTGGKDYSKHGSCVESDAGNYLMAQGYAVQRMYRCDPHTNTWREDWPLLWVKDNPLFIGYIASTVLNTNSHAVTVKEDGTVLDPWREGTFKLSDYESISMLLAVFDVSAVHSLLAEMEKMKKDLESGFMVGAYARLSYLQAAETERGKLKGFVERIVKADAISPGWKAEAETVLKG